MSLLRLALRNISSSAFRSGVVALCALLVASFTLATTLVIRGAENSLQLAVARLGADIVVVPEGTQTEVESALLMGVPARVWMPEDNLAAIAALPGVAGASPQVYLSTLVDAACCSVSDMFLVAYDPATDFTVRPWLDKEVGDALHLGEAVGGYYVFVPEGEQNIRLYGYFITLVANMEATGTGLDQTMFLTMETARDIARISTTMAEEPLEIPARSVSAVLVKLKPGYHPIEASLDIMRAVPGVTPITTPELFQAYRQQMNGVMASISVILAITWGLSLLLIGLVFSMAANERRRELGVLRALGATPAFVLRALLVEAGALALAGGLTGLAFTSLTVFLFRRAIVSSLGLPYKFPSLPVLLMQVGAGLLIALVSVTLAALLPAIRVSRQDPAIAMRE